MHRRAWLAAAFLLAATAIASAQEEAPVEDPTPRKREWLSGHQSADGGWSAHGFQSQCEGEPCPGTGDWEGDTGTTGLALLVYLGFGETHRTPRYGPVVGRGAARLTEIQFGDGCFGIRYPERFLVDHAIATLAMAELADLSESWIYKSVAAKGAAFLLSQRGADGGWRAGDRFLESDAVTTLWALWALLSARRTGVDLDPEVLTGAVAFIDGLTDPETGRVRLHRYKEGFSDSAVAAAVLVRIHGGAEREDPVLRKGEAVLLGALPSMDRPVDPEYWYLGTRAAFELGGDTWKKWNESMKRTIIDSQVMDKESCRHGSWDPVEGPSEEMGRVPMTAYCILCLETYYRYAHVFGSKDPVPEKATPAPPRPSARTVNRAAALDLDFPEPRTGSLR